MLHRGNGAEPETLDPAKSTGVPEANIQVELFEGLLTYSASGAVVPGVAEKWATDLADAVAYAQLHKDEPAKSGAVYGGVAGGPSEESDAIIKFFMADMMDKQSSIPA